MVCSSSFFTYSNVFPKSLTLCNVIRTGSNVLGGVKELTGAAAAVAFLGITGSFAGLVTGPGIIYLTTVETLPKAEASLRKLSTESCSGLSEWIPIARTVECIAGSVVETSQLLIHPQKISSEALESKKKVFAEKLAISDLECFRLVGFFQFAVPFVSILSEVGMVSLEVLKCTVMGLGISYIMQGLAKLALGGRNYYECYKFRREFDEFNKTFDEMSSWNDSELKKTLANALSNSAYSSRVIDPSYLERSSIESLQNVSDVANFLEKVSGAMDAQSSRNLAVIFTGLLLVIGGACLIAADVLTGGNSTAALSLGSAIFFLLVVLLSYKPTIDWALNQVYPRNSLAV